MNLTSELSIFAYKEPKESGARGGEEVEKEGGRRKERARRRFEGEAGAERTGTGRVIGKALD